MARQSRQQKIELKGRHVVFVDAYNLIYADPMLKEALLTKPEIARDHLRTLCRAYVAKHSDHTVCLVFDGDSSVGRIAALSRAQSVSRRDGIREIFTESDASADRRILVEVRKLAGKTAPIVVTNDAEVIWNCRELGAEILRPEVFIDISRPDKKVSRRRSRSTAATASDSRDKLLNPQEKDDIISEMEALYGDEMDRSLDEL